MRDSRRLCRKNSTQIFQIPAGVAPPLNLAAKPGPGITPVSVGSCTRKPSTSAACSIDRPVNTRSFTNWRPAGLPEPISSAPRPMPAVRRASRGWPDPDPANRTCCRSPPCFSRFLRRALSIRMRRMASAAAAKKWPRLSQCCCLPLASEQPQVSFVDQPVASSVCPGFS